MIPARSICGWRPASMDEVQWFRLDGRNEFVDGHQAAVSLGQAVAFPDWDVVGACHRLAVGGRPGAGMRTGSLSSDLH